MKHQIYTHGKARQGMARPGKARRGRARLGTAWQGKARLGFYQAKMR